MRASSFAFLAALAAILVFAFGCAQAPGPIVDEPVQPVLQPGLNNTTAAAPAEEAPCSSGNIVQKDECFALLAKSRSSPDMCRNIYAVDKLDSCYALFAASNLDVCKKITDADLRASCLTENAKKQKSDEICRLIDNEDARAACLQQVVPPCMLKLDPVERSLCLALEKKDYKLCNGDACFEGYAINVSDDAACYLITGEADRYSCIAIIKKSIAICKSASQSPVQDWCIERTSMKLDDKDGCSLATPGSDYANRCHLYFAVKGHDVSLCKRAYQEEQRDTCYSDYAIKTMNVSSCARVINSLVVITCYRNAAIKNKMPSLCNPLANEANRRDCYAGSILYIEGGPLPSDCAGVSSPDWKDKCYYRAARATYNSTLCGFIDDGSPDKKDCTDLFPQ